MRTVIISILLQIVGLGSISQEFQVGSTAINFVDPTRNNRLINTALYYPSEQTGADVPVASGEFPVVVFGHGYVMVHTAYQYLWLYLVPQGYIIAFPTTEGTFAPNHLDLGLDLAFIVSAMKLENLDQNSLFYGSIAETSAIMGHSMGGGASFLACSNNVEPTTMVTFAAANTSPSAIQAAETVTIPTLLFSGEFDCITPPQQHQYPMYQATAAQQKIIIDIAGGGHCYFADYNLFCSIGEAMCSPQPAITRQQQHSVVLDFLSLYFDFMLKENSNTGTVFFDSLQVSPRIDYLMHWQTSGSEQLQQSLHVNVYPIPFRNTLIIKFTEPRRSGSIIIWNASGQKIFEFSASVEDKVEINTRLWQRGVYIVALVTGTEIVRRKVLKL